MAILPLFIASVFLAFVFRFIVLPMRSLGRFPGLSWWAKSLLCRGRWRIGYRLLARWLLNCWCRARLIRASILRMATLRLGFPVCVFTLPIVLRSLRRIICTVGRVIPWRGWGLLLPLGLAKLRCFPLLIVVRASILRTATLRLVFPTQVFTWLVAIIFGANRMLLFGGAWIVAPSILALIGWQGCGRRD